MTSRLVPPRSEVSPWHGNLCMSKLGVIMERKKSHYSCVTILDPCPVYLHDVSGGQQLQQQQHQLCLSLNNWSTLLAVFCSLVVEKGLRGEGCVLCRTILCSLKSDSQVSGVGAEFSVAFVVTSVYGRYRTHIHCCVMHVTRDMEFLLWNILIIWVVILWIIPPVNATGECYVTFQRVLVRRVSCATFIILIGKPKRLQSSLRSRII